MAKRANLSDMSMQLKIDPTDRFEMVDKDIQNAVWISCLKQ